MLRIPRWVQYFLLLVLREAFTHLQGGSAFFDLLSLRQRSQIPSYCEVDLSLDEPIKRIDDELLNWLSLYHFSVRSEYH